MHRPTARRTGTIPRGLSTDELRACQASAAAAAIKQIPQGVSETHGAHSLRQPRDHAGRPDRSVRPFGPGARSESGKRLPRARECPRPRRSCAWNGDGAAETNNAPRVFRELAVVTVGLEA